MAKKRNPALDDGSADPSKLDLSLLPQTAKEMRAALRKTHKEHKKYNQDLCARAKTAEQLTEGLECTVLEVNSYQGSTSFTPRSEMVIGGQSQSYGGGHVYRTEIRVNSGTLVEKLQFKGWPPLEVGDIIRAYIMKGKKEEEKHSFDPSLSFDSFLTQNLKTHLVEREYQPVEQPSKIDKIRDDKVVATYHNC